MVHQVNCQGIMGAGLALQIKNKYPEAYNDYMQFVAKYKHNLLGQICTSKCNNGKYIVHLFGQENYGKNKIQTDYDAFEKALVKLVWDSLKQESGRLYGLSVAIPYKIGCGLAGGDWTIIHKIIEEIFEEYEVTIYQLE